MSKQTIDRITLGIAALVVVSALIVSKSCGERVKRQQQEQRP